MGKKPKHVAGNDFNNNAWNEPTSNFQPVNNMNNGQNYYQQPANQATTAFASQANQSTGSFYVPQGTQLSKPKRSKKPLFITLGVIVGILVLIYAIGCFFFSSHFFPKTSFSNHDVSFESNTDFANEIGSRVKDYQLTIEGQGFSCTLNANQANLNIDKSQVAKDACLNQNYLAWPVEVFKSHDVSDVIEATFDKENAHSILSDKISTYNSTATESKNAKIVYQDSAKLCVIEKEVYGTQIDKEALLKKADECLKTLSTSYTVTEDDFIKPTVLSSDSRFVSALEKVNKMAGGEISLTLNGSISAGKITKAMIAEWITINDNIEPVLNEEAIQQWASEMGTELNTYQTKRTWTRADGKECSASGGSYGWIVNSDSLASTVIEQIKSCNFTAIDIPCEQTADVYKGAGKRDWGSYVDVDLTEQIVRYYDANDNLLYTANCISGSPSGNHATPTGVYRLNSNDGESTLVGEKDANGNPEYETKVAYWMPFIGNGIGLHDASWQAWGSWNNTLYSSGAGSHGCINLSVSDAAWFHDNLTVGVCIITHD